MIHEKSKKLNVLDCTLRDGGYYTNWTFSEPLVSEYLETLVAMGVDAVELGYAGKGPDAGVFAQLTNYDVARLRPDPNIMLAVMLDAKDFFGPEDTLAERILRALGQKMADGIDAIRIAVHFSQVRSCLPMIDLLASQGYRVFLNLMQIDLAGPEGIAQCLDIISGLSTVEAVYVADSFGSMSTHRVQELVMQISQECAVATGFHAHDNCGLAIANAMAAKGAGATWLDVTIAGMGRGAGNARTEQLMQMLPQSGQARDMLQQLIARYFNPLHRKYGWGDSVFYQAGAMMRLHPSYVQEALCDQTLSGSDTLTWIRTIPEGTAVFDPEVLAEARRCAFSSEGIVPDEIECVA